MTRSDCYIFVWRHGFFLGRPLSAQCSAARALLIIVGTSIRAIFLTKNESCFVGLYLGLAVARSARQALASYSDVLVSHVSIIAAASLMFDGDDGVVAVPCSPRRIDKNHTVTVLFTKVCIFWYTNPGKKKIKLYRQLLYCLRWTCF